MRYIHTSYIHTYVTIIGIERHLSIFENHNVCGVLDMFQGICDEDDALALTFQGHDALIEEMLTHMRIHRGERIYQDNAIHTYIY
jgi:hypothetical protein